MTKSINYRQYSKLVGVTRSINQSSTIPNASACTSGTCRSFANAVRPYASVFPAASLISAFSFSSPPSATKSRANVLSYDKTWEIQG